jgi:chromate transporter
VVGVVLNLAVWFGFNVLFPANQGVDLFDLILAALAFTLMQYAKVGLVPVVAASAFLGLIYRTAF